MNQRHSFYSLCYFSTMKSNQKSPADEIWTKSVSIQLKNSNAPLLGLHYSMIHAVWNFFKRCIPPDS